jgi:ABC-type Fe3+/spermidine/putrescine transport system ATPase subunit
VVATKLRNLRHTIQHPAPDFSSALNLEPAAPSRRMNSPLLQVHNLSKSYEGAPLLCDVSFDVQAGEIVCLLGPSGAGKTTLLRMIAGLEEIEAGKILFEGRDLRGVPVHQRGFGLMFQDLALFPHRRVYDNVAFGLRMQNASEQEIRKRVEETLALVGLEPARFAARDVNHLSGGEQQRVALARSLAPRPRFLMFDEPLGALDRILREQLVSDLRALLKRIGMTALYVTHDQEEAFGIADRLVILNEGRIQQIGAPNDVYRHPINAFVARFLGLTNLIPARVLEIHAARIRAATNIGIFEFDADVDARVGADGFVLLRPRALRAILSEANGTDETNTGVNVLRGRVVESLLRAGHTRLVTAVNGYRFTFEWEESLPSGEKLIFLLDSARLAFLSS